MPRVALDLNNPSDLAQVKGQWRVSPGLVPGEANEGLTAQLLFTPARLTDYDDSGWEVCDNIRQSLSVGFTFAWYRIKVELPETVNGMPVAGARLWFETNADNYGEVWVNGEIDRTAGAIVGLNNPQRIELATTAEPGATYVIACLVANGPLAEPRGGIFLRYAYLALEATDN